MRIQVPEGATVFVVASGEAAPIAVNGRVVAHDGQRLVIELDSDCAADASPLREPMADVVERRQRPRYPTWLDATMHSTSSPEGQPAVITDLSSDGASVETDEWTGETFFRVVFEVHGEPLRLECEAIHKETTWRGVLLNTRFVLRDPQQTRILEGIVSALESVFGEAQETLAGANLIANHA
jgi:hypothetical protein